jgi:hypothetical protein
MARVVIGIAGPNITVVGHLVPFLARDLARFTTDADSRVGEKSNRRTFLDVGMTSLIRAVRAFANHQEKKNLETGNPKKRIEKL